MSFEEIEGSREETEHTSNDNSFQGAQILEDVVNEATPRDKQQGQAESHLLAPRDSCHPITQ